MVSLTKTNPAPTKASTGLYCCYLCLWLLLLGLSRSPWTLT